MPIEIVDSYSEANKDAVTSVASGGVTALGQSFTGNDFVLDSAKFYGFKFGSPTGSIFAKVYAHSGTFGTSSVPTGSALATSDSVDVSTLSGSFALITFTFSAADKIDLVSGTKYVVTIEYAGGNGSNRVDIGYDSASASHGGNYCQLSGTWSAFSGLDTCFYVYGEPPPPLPSLAIVPDFERYYPDIHTREA
jgi:hypothetical protein